MEIERRSSFSVTTAPTTTLPAGAGPGDYATTDEKLQAWHGYDTLPDGSESSTNVNDEMAFALPAGWSYPPPWVNVWQYWDWEGDTEDFIIKGSVLTVYKNWLAD
jgi:hypothetical protein